MIAEIFGPPGAGNARFDQEPYPKPGVGLNLVGSHMARTPGASFIRTMPALNPYRSLGRK
jgi:hypothetical protein